MFKMTTFILCDLYHHFLKFKWKKKLLSTCRRWSNDISNWSCQKRLHGEEDIWNEPFKADGLKIDRKGHSRWTEPQEQRHIEKEKKKSRLFSLPLHQPLTNIFPAIKPLEPVFVIFYCNISVRHGSPASLPSSLPILPLPASCSHTVSPVSFQPSKMSSSTKACFQPGRGVPAGVFNNSKHPETLTPLLTDLVLLFFFLLGYQKLKKKLPQEKKRKEITSSPTKADLDCKSSLSDRHLQCPVSLIKVSLTHQHPDGGGEGRGSEDGFQGEFFHNLQKDY